MTHNWFQTDDCLWVRLNLADMLKMERYPEINNWRTVLYTTGSFYIDFLPCFDCQILKLFTKLFSILWTLIFVYILQNMCPEIIILSILTHDLFNSGDEKIKLPSRKYMMSHVVVFQLNTTGKGKLIDQFESNSQMRSTFFWIHTTKLS